MDFYVFLVGVVGVVAGAAIGAVAVARGMSRAVHLQAEIRDSEMKQAELRDMVTKLTAQHAALDEATKELQALSAREQSLAADVATLEDTRKTAEAEITEIRRQSVNAEEKLVTLKRQLDLYTRIDDFVAVGHFDEPDYLYETSERFTAEIRNVRQQQREMIKAGTAVEFPSDPTFVETKAATDRVLKGQAKLMLKAFNLDCDLIIGKVRPSNYSRTLERIEKLAATVDKMAASLHCGIAPAYVALKYEECTLQYQYTLRKKEEQEEQKLIREQMREEARARREYEQAEKKALQQERAFERMLREARAAATQAAEADRMEAELRIQALERQLAEATATRERAKAMAELTRRGHVYVISNIGSFGEGVYKIGLTRRLDPIERVKELGDASVPFPFDVHAIIYVEDAPALEASLHQKFDHRRLNAVNRRKEFFRVSLDEIRDAAEAIVGDELEFRVTIAAEEYFESRRLQAETATP